MLGKILSTVTRTVTLPVDAANAALDVACGGDGSKKSRMENPATGDLERIRDEVAEDMEDIDRE